MRNRCCRALTSWKPTPIFGSFQTGKRTSVRHAACGSDVTIGPMMNSLDMGFAGLAVLAPGDRRAERHRDQRDLRRRIGVGERAADRPPRPRRRMADMRHHLGKQRQLGADQRIVFDRILPGGGADRRSRRHCRGCTRVPGCARCRSAASAAPAASPSAGPASARRRSAARRRRPRARRRPRRVWRDANTRTLRVSSGQH